MRAQNNEPEWPVDARARSGDGDRGAATRRSAANGLKVRPGGVRPGLCARDFEGGSSNEI